MKTCNHQNLLIQKFILMEVISASKCRTIRQKKNHIIHPNSSNTDNERTPNHSVISETPIKSLQYHQPNNNFLSRSCRSGKKQQKELPQNALLKRCFQRNRTIKSIKDLEQLYQSKILSKSKYRFKPEESLNQTRNSNKSETFLNRKNILNKIPTNILATESSILSNSTRARSRSKDSHHTFSQSRIIKQSIIRYE